MYSIALCEDEKVSLDFESSLIREWAASKKVRLDTYSSAEEFIFESEDRPPYNLLILDIQMKRMNGYELAETLRKRGCTASLIFITGITDYAIQGYEVGAVRYILKPVKKEVFFPLLDQLYEKEKMSLKECFILEQGNDAQKIPFEDIIYLEANEHYVKLCGKTFSKEWKAAFSEVTKSFEGKGFFLLKRGLLVNLLHVEQISRTDCLVSNGEKLPVSRGVYKDLNEAFIAENRIKNES